MVYGTPTVIKSVTKVKELVSEIPDTFCSTFTQCVTLLVVTETKFIVKIFVYTFTSGSRPVVPGETRLHWVFTLG